MKLFLMIALIGFTYRLDKVKTRKSARPIVARDRVSAMGEANAGICVSRTKELPPAPQICEARVGFQAFQPRSA